MEPSFGERSVINHRDYLTNSRVVTSSAIDITETEVLTAEGRLIAYDYLVIATGHADSVPKTRTERLHEYHDGITDLFSSPFFFKFRNKISERLCGHKSFHHILQIMLNK